MVVGETSVVGVVVVTVVLHDVDALEVLDQVHDEEEDTDVRCCRR